MWSDFLIKEKCLWNEYKSVVALALNLIICKGKIRIGEGRRGKLLLHVADWFVLSAHPVLVLIFSVDHSMGIVTGAARQFLSFPRPGSLGLQ